MVTRDGAGPRILVAGASGLIGCFVAADLARRGHDVLAVARRFGPNQAFGLARCAMIEARLVELDPEGLADLLAGHRIEVVVNCIGILQDGPGADSEDVHEGFVRRLVTAIRTRPPPPLLIQIGVPGHEDEDRTAFSATKRRGERIIRDAGIPFAILRPGLVLAPAAYGGSALLRGLAALPIDLPPDLAARPLAVVAVEEVAATVDLLVARWAATGHALHESLDLMHPDPTSVGAVLALLRSWLGHSPSRRIVLPMAALRLGAGAGDLAARLGWSPPIRTSALAELCRGVSGDPGPWLATTGLRPRTLRQILVERPATVQERWFAGLYLLKPIALVTLAGFWCVSGLIALTVAYDAAVATLTGRGFPNDLAHAITIASSCIDIGIGAAIAVRGTCRPGLLAGIAVSAFYMLGAAVLTPDLWLEPLGALVKTGPAIVLMAIALTILDKR